MLCFFHGDSPTCSFEIGHQKGGNYFCWDCGIFAEKSDDITHAYYNDSQPIQSRLDKIKETSTSQDKIINNPLKLNTNHNTIDLIDELHQRKIKFFQNQTKDSLSTLLVKEMKGIKRGPA